MVYKQWKWNKNGIYNDFAADEYMVRVYPINEPKRHVIMVMSFRDENNTPILVDDKFQGSAREAKNKGLAMLAGHLIDCRTKVIGAMK